MSEEPKQDLVPVLAPAVKFAFSIPARKTGFEGFNATDEEALEIATQLDLCAREYFPQLSEGASVAMVALGTICFVSATKYGAYVDWQQKQRKAAAPTPEREQEINRDKEIALRREAEEPGIDPSAFFPRANQ